ncbi:hypothetical protein D0Z08_29845 [Nocardioides immobilis]|uniref:TolB-like translocation protein n=1 Tax=Nocardioides immobilis TaxID=2049295 RepID=A0A417XT62_9ACTN|nr:hypothetical protein [Nocardioides immobilis]RHW23431.1 hypothetical protein D0Z08_29845 [Nocardioides immobilis]
MIDRLSLRARMLIAAAGAVLLVIAAVAYIVAVRDADELAPTSGQPMIDGPRMLVVSERKLATISATDMTSSRHIHDVDCVRSYAAADTSVCMRPKDAWTHTLVTMTGQLEDTHEYKLPGVPSRARVSDSGRMVSWTTFVGGDSYTSSGMSTRTGVIDTQTGDYLPSIEHFSVTLDGKPYQAADVNYWGVSFADDDNTFYATLATGGERYLVRGDFNAETVETLATNVECPSISPDGTRLAFKQAIDNDPQKGWRISVLELSTMEITNLSETRSIDDQPAWLDNETVAYTFRAADGVPSVWSVPANGTGTPRKLADNAESPAPLP